MSSESSEDLVASAKPQEVVGEDMLEHLRCHYCKGYLSCSPLRVLPDGHSICSRCEPPNNDVPLYRTLALENILAKVTFPCRFQKDGCSIRMLFELVFAHENVCEYQTFTCFAAALGSCSWKGQGSDISKHFLENHQEYWVEEKEQFRVVVEEDSKQDLLVFEKQNVFTMFQYSYNSANKILEYCIQYLPVNEVTPEVFYNIELCNIANRTPHITIKNVPCLYQQTHASAPNTLSKIMLEPYEDILESPDIIVFSINMMFEERLPYSEGNKRTWEEMMLEGVKTHSLNYNLKSLKCALCGIYVTPPLFKNTEGELVCTDCGQKNEDCSSYEDEKIKRFMGEANYPCRWARCNVTRKVDSIRQHEMNCMYRTFNCVVVTCKEVYKRGQVLYHFEKYHRDYSYFKEDIVFEVLATLNQYDEPIKKKLFMVKDDQAIIIKFIYNNNNKFVFKLAPLSASPYITAFVQHRWCRWRSVDFSMPNDFELNGCCSGRYIPLYMIIFKIKQVADV